MLGSIIGAGNLNRDQDMTISYVNVYYTPRDLTLNEWQRLMVAKMECRMQVAPISSTPLAAERTLALSIVVPGEFTTSEAIYLEAERLVAEYQEQVPSRPRRW